MTTRTHVSIGTEARTCDRHGPYEATLWDLQPKPAGYPNVEGRVLADFLKPFWSRCPSCDSEIQREVDEQHAAIRSGKSKVDALIATHFHEAGIPKALSKSSLDNYRAVLAGQKTALAAARDFAYGFEVQSETGRSMVFLGRTGNGKSHLAVAILRHIILKGATARYVTAFDLLAKLKASFAKNSTVTFDAMLDRYVTPDLLVLDEIGKQTSSDFDFSTIFGVIDRRYASQKPIIMISNLDETGFKTLMGEPIFDRLRDRGGRLVRFNWESQRGENR